MKSCEKIRCHKFLASDTPDTAEEDAIRGSRRERHAKYIPILNGLKKRLLVHWPTQFFFFNLEIDSRMMFKILESSPPIKPAQMQYLWYKLISVEIVRHQKNGRQLQNNFWNKNMIQ